MKRIGPKWRQPVRHGAELLIAMVLIGGIYGFSIQQAARAQSQPDEELASQLQQLLAPSTTDPANLRTVNSSLGFKLTYNKAILEGQGQVTDAAPTDKRFTVTGTTYTDEELSERRDYSLVSFEPAETDQSEVGSFPPKLTVLTNIRAGYWDSRVGLSKYAGKSKLEIWVAETTKSKQDSGYVASKAITREINGTTYTEVTYTYTSKAEVPYISIDRYYFTVQNDRPYYAVMYGIQSGNEVVAVYESVIKSIEYGELDSEALVSSGGAHNNVLAAQDGLPTDTSNIPQGFSTEGLLDVVARNQIAVVRVGMIKCMDIDLVLSSGTTVGTIENACAAGVGSGSIITDDGYIATNGHVVNATKYDALSTYLALSSTVDELATRSQPIMNFLVARGDLSESQSRAFLEAVRKKDSFAIQRAIGLTQFLENSEIVSRNESPAYAIQLSDTPLKFDSANTKLSFIFGETVVPATFVGDNFEGISEDGRVNFETLKGTDVAILKVEGTFPLVDLGDILNIQTSDRLTAIGYPGFVDGGLQTTKDRTVPSITQGYVESLENQTADSQYKLIVTSVPIAQGNSGGPSFNDSGVQIGLNTYSILPCQDGQCFGNGIIRDIGDLKQLAAVQGVNFGKAGSITDNWRQGLEALKLADYVKAAKKFNKVAADYHGHYLAVAMRSLAETKAGVEIDYDELPVGLVAGIGIGFIILLAGGVAFVIFVRRHHHKAEIKASAAIQSPPVPQTFTHPVHVSQDQPVSELPIRPPTNAPLATTTIQPMPLAKPQVPLETVPTPSTSVQSNNPAMQSGNPVVISPQQKD